MAQHFNDYLMRIANATVESFKERGLTVRVKFERSYERDTTQFTVQELHSPDWRPRGETPIRQLGSGSFEITDEALREWVCDTSQGLRLTNGQILFLKRVPMDDPETGKAIGVTTPLRELSGDQQRRLK